jgi:hypothetical protein
MRAYTGKRHNWYVVVQYRTLGELKYSVVKVDLRRQHIWLRYSFLGKDWEVEFAWEDGGERSLSKRFASMIMR